MLCSSPVRDLNTCWSRCHRRVSSRVSFFSPSPFSSFKNLAWPAYRRQQLSRSVQGRSQLDALDIPPGVPEGLSKVVAFLLQVCGTPSQDLRKRRSMTWLSDQARRRLEEAAARRHPIKLRYTQWCRGFLAEGWCPHQNGPLGCFFAHSEKQLRRSVSSAVTVSGFSCPES